MMATPTNKHSEEPTQNRILAALPKTDYERLLPNLELVQMPLGWTMSESGDHVNYLHFPISGIVSLIYSLEDGSSSEVALVGNEGMVGVSIFMGGESMPSSTEVQSVGVAYRLSRKAMKAEFALGGQLQRLAPGFRVDGRDVYVDLPVSPWEAVLGASITIPTPDTSLQLSIPPGSAAGRKLRLKGKGIPGNPPGDLYAVLVIALPPADTEAAKVAYRDMELAFDFNPRAQHGG